MPHQVLVSSSLRKRTPNLLLQRACLATLESCRARTSHIDIYVVGAKRMRRMNCDYLNHDYVTDVLSFDLGIAPGGIHIGQLVICEAFAQMHARREKLSLKEELARYVVHGTLHLLGYDDHSDEERAKMWKVQERIVKKALASS